jgi:flavorubredoxin
MIIDGVEKSYRNEWLSNIQKILNRKEPDFILIQHAEPDSSGSFIALMELYPKIKVVSSMKSFSLLKKYYKKDFNENRIIIKEGDTINLGKHILHFIEAPMIHWPEVIMTYDEYSKSFFSSDAFGKFGANDIDEPWEDEARRFFYGILGKYEKQVQSLLNKLKNFEIKNIYPGHGPILTEKIDHYISLYDKWSKFIPEEKGVVIVYASIYGHTKIAIDKLIEKLKSLNVKYVVHNLSFSHISDIVADAFKYSNLVLGSITYHDDIYPSMRIFINTLVNSNYQNRFVSIIENYSWKSNKGGALMKKLSNCKNLSFYKQVISINSSAKERDIENINQLALELYKNSK